MKTTGVRIEVQEDFYEKLIKNQEKRRLVSGKITALAVIIMEYCKIGFTQEESETTELSGLNYQQKDSIPDQNFNNLLREKKGEIREREKELKQWEAELREREFDLIGKSKANIDNAEALLEQRNDIYNQKEKLLHKSNDGIIFKIEKENYVKTIEEKNLRLKQMQQELNDMKENIYKNILKIDKKTDSNPFMKFVLPLLPAVTTAVCTYILNGKLRAMENMSQVEKDIIKSFKDLSEEDQEEVKKYVAVFVEKNEKKK